MATLKLRIGGMRDAADEDRIESVLREETGVLGAVANRTTSCAEIEYEDDEVSMERLVNLVNALGFTAELAG